MTKNSCRDVSFVSNEWKHNGFSRSGARTSIPRTKLAVCAKLVTYRPIILACKLQRRVRNDRFLWHFNMLKATSRTNVKQKQPRTLLLNN